MENEKRMIELLTDMLVKSDRMDDKFDKMLNWQNQTVEELKKLNMISSENKRVLLKLADLEKEFQN